MKQKQVLCFKGVEDVEEEIVTFLIGNYLPPPPRSFRLSLNMFRDSEKESPSARNLIKLFKISQIYCSYCWIFTDLQDF